MPSTGFERAIPAVKLIQTYAVDHTTVGIGTVLFAYLNSRKSAKNCTHLFTSHGVLFLPGFRKLVWSTEIRDIIMTPLRASKPVYPAYLIYLYSQHLTVMAWCIKVWICQSVTLIDTSHDSTLKNRIQSEECCKLLGLYEEITSRFFSESYYLLLQYPFLNVLVTN
jgi:hypothetical protein